MMSKHEFIEKIAKKVSETKINTYEEWLGVIAQFVLEEAAAKARKWDTSHRDDDGTVHHSKIGDLIADDFMTLIEEKKL
jgi:hypothetical protein